jgi:flagellin-like protein
MKRKGITPLVGTALLILIAISAVTGSAVFLRDTTQGVTDSVDDHLQQEERQENSGIDIEYAYNSSGEIWIVVRNTGEYTLTVEEDDQKSWNLYIDDRPQTFTYSGGSATTKMLDPGETLTVDTNSAMPSPGSYKTVEIQGTYGTSSSIICDNTAGSGGC